VAKITAASRKKLPKSDFVEKGTRTYPIPDAAHARDALARSSGKPEHASVVAAVKRKFPKIKITKGKQSSRLTLLLQTSRPKQWQSREQ